MGACQWGGAGACGGRLLSHRCLGFCNKKDVLLLLENELRREQKQGRAGGYCRFWEWESLPGIIHPRPGGESVNEGVQPHGGLRMTAGSCSDHLSGDDLSMTSLSLRAQWLRSPSPAHLKPRAPAASPTARLQPKGSGAEPGKHLVCLPSWKVKRALGFQEPMKAILYQ